MRKIISAPRAKSPPTRQECAACGCVFEYENDDLNSSGDPPVYWIECPGCRAHIGGAKWVKPFVG